MDHTYDPHEARCVSWNDLRRMFSDDGPTRANLICLVDCLQFKPKAKDTFQPAVRVERPGAPAHHDSVVSEVMARIGPALSHQINAAITGALGNLMPAPQPLEGGGGNGDDDITGGNGGGNGDDAPPVPVGYGDPRVHQPSEVHGHPDQVNPKDFEGQLALAKDTTDLKPQPQPVPLSVEELEQLRAKIADA